MKRPPRGAEEKPGLPLFLSHSPYFSLFLCVYLSLLASPFPGLSARADTEHDSGPASPKRLDLELVQDETKEAERWGITMMDVIVGLLEQYRFPLPLSLFMQPYISTSGVGCASHRLVPTGFSAASPSLCRFNRELLAISWQSFSVPFPQKAFKADYKPDATPPQ